MSKFCGNCGARMDDDARVCGICGTVFDTDSRASAPDFGRTQPKKNGGKKYTVVGLGTLAAIAVVVVIIIVISASGNSCEDVIDKYINSSYRDPDAAGIIELVPEGVLSHFIIENGTTRREIADAMQVTLDEAVSSADSYCDSWNISYEITDEDACSPSEIRLLSDDCEDEYGFSVSEAKEITVEMKTSYVVDGETDEYTNDYTFELIKTDGKWYLWSLNGSNVVNMLYN